MSRIPILCLLWALLTGGLPTHAQTWLHLNNSLEYVDIGDLDVTGDQLTVEAKIYQTQASLADIVSKHQGGSNVNYLLRPYQAEITTTNGYAATPVYCGASFQYAELNTCLHIAMVYDGTTLSHYINGNLNSQTPATGNLVTNNYTTKIGTVASLSGILFFEQFYGYIDEVRIWNVARTPSEIEAYRNTSLPTPTALPGLVAYYQFNTLANLAGNTAYDGTLTGAGTLGVTNSFCPSLGGSCFAILEGETFQPAPQPSETRDSPFHIRQLARTFDIQLTPTESSWAQIEILASDGRQVFEWQNLLQPSATYHATTPSLSPGWYAIHIRQNGSFQTQKVWLQP